LTPSARRSPKLVARGMHVKITKYPWAL
jgi:hypothetical protein